MSYVIELNDYQKKALDLQRDIIVSAGAGSGKTRVLVSRYCELFNANPALSLDNVVAITFTEKSAAELRERVDKFFRQIIASKEHSSQRMRYKDFGENLSKAWIGTIHGFCSKILREFPMEARVDSNFAILDESEATALLDEALEDFLVITSKNPASYLADDLKQLVQYFDKDAIKNFLSFLIKDRDKAEPHIKNLKGPKSYISSLSRLYLEALKEYDSRKRFGISLDFTDLLIKATNLVGENKSVRQKLQDRFRYILVDEFQDTDPLQWKLIELLTGDRKSGCLFLVGDPKQSIYGFRRADVRLFNDATESIIKKNRAEGKNNLNLKFQGRAINASTDEKLGAMQLPVNYRSVPAVIDFVNFVFEKIMAPEKNCNNAPEKDYSNAPEDDCSNVRFDPLLADKKKEEGGVEIIYTAEESIETSSLEQESELMAKRILQLLDEGSSPHFAPKDIAILMRSSTYLKEIEEALIHYHIPFITTGGKGFYDRQEIMDLCNFIKFLISPDNDIALFGLLRSPYIHLEDKDNLLYWISGFKAESFWDKINIAANKNKNLKDVANMLYRYHSLAQRIPLSQILKDFLTETKGWEYLSSGIESQRKMENVEKFITLARDFDDSGFQSLVDFSEQIETQKELAEHEAEAPILVEDVDAVKIMTIHKAKGLEFQVVILPRISQKFNDKTSPCLIDEEDGIVLKVKDKKSTESDAYTKISQKQKQKDINEEKRIFYVGATRAEKLLILGITKPKKNFNSRLKMLEEVFGPMDAKQKEGKIKYCINGRKRVIPIISQNNIGSQKHRAATVTTPVRQDEKPKTAAPLSIPELRRVYDISKLMAFARAPEGYYLKYIIGLPEDALDLSSGKAHENGSHDTPKLNMLRGTIIHALLEKFPFKNKSDAKAIIKTFLDNEKSLAQKERESLSSEIQTFWSKMEKHEYIKNFATYKERHSELPFQIAFGHDLLVGRVDACVKDASGNWMVIDFKTGYKNHNEQQMKQLYKIQIESYALFLSLFVPNQNNWEVHIYMPDSEFVFKNKYGSSDIKKIRKNLEGLIKSEKDFRKKRGLF